METSRHARRAAIWGWRAALTLGAIIWGYIAVQQAGASFGWWPAVPLPSDMVAIASFITAGWMLHVGWQS